MKESAVVKIKILALGAALVSVCTVAACSFGPDAYNGVPVCPGAPPPDGVMVAEGQCWDGGLPPDAGADADTSTAGGGAGTGGGAAVAGGAGASTAGTGG